MPEDDTELEALRQAVETYVKARNDEPVIVHSAILVWEQMSFEKVDDPNFEVNWSIPSDGVSMSAAVGLMEAGKAVFLDHILNPPEED